MSDTKINIEVVCGEHPTEKLEVVSERNGTQSAFQIHVSPCAQCLVDATERADPPPKTVDIIFNESNFTSQTIEV